MVVGASRLRIDIATELKYFRHNDSEFLHSNSNCSKIKRKA
jgi:hypothetical protein